MKLDFGKLQEEVNEWQHYNFDARVENSWCPAMGLGEETGELIELDESIAGLAVLIGRLHRSVLKRFQKIRGSDEEHKRKIKSEIGDIVIYLNSYCGLEEIDFEEAVRDKWEQVKQRDWVNHPTTGAE